MSYRRVAVRSGVSRGGDASHSGVVSDQLCVVPPVARSPVKGLATYGPEIEAKLFERFAGKEVNER